jgi:hypothetical protein
LPGQTIEHRRRRRRVRTRLEARRGAGGGGAQGRGGAQGLEEIDPAGPGAAAAVSEDGAEAVFRGEDGNGVEERVAQTTEDGVHRGVAADCGGEGGADAHGSRVVGEAAGDDGAVALASHGRVRPDGLRGRSVFIAVGCMDDKG